MGNPATESLTTSSKKQHVRIIISSSLPTEGNKLLLLLLLKGKCFFLHLCCYWGNEKRTNPKIEVLNNGRTHGKWEREREWECQRNRSCVRNEIERPPSTPDEFRPASISSRRNKKRRRRRLSKSRSPKNPTRVTRSLFIFLFGHGDSNKTLLLFNTSSNLPALMSFWVQSNPAVASTTFFSDNNLSRYSSSSRLNLTTATGCCPSAGDSMIHSAPQCQQQTSAVWEKRKKKRKLAARLVASQVKGRLTQSALAVRPYTAAAADWRRAGVGGA